MVPSEPRFEQTALCDARIERVDVSVYTVPTDGPEGQEADGTLVWSSTTMVLVEVHAGGKVGLGYTYGDASVARLIASTLKPELEGQHTALVGALWRRLDELVRNTGRSGAAALARSAVDIALWDLKAKLLDLPLFLALTPYRDHVSVYGSGGFCNYSLERLASQVSGWARQGIARIKIKTSRNPEQDDERLSICRAELGDEAMLMTDANGALSRKEALKWAWRFRERWDVAWFEEPVSSDDLEGLRLIRDQGPPGLDVAAGEYGFTLRDFRALLQAGAVDCLQADVTRCGGISGLLQVAGLCAAHELELSAHCAPALSAHAFCAVPRLRHLEYFHDHVRVENMLFDGASSPVQGSLYPDRTRPGLGLELKHKDAERFRV